LSIRLALRSSSTCRDRQQACKSEKGGAARFTRARRSGPLGLFLVDWSFIEWIDLDDATHASHSDSGLLSATRSIMHDHRQWRHPLSLLALTSTAQFSRAKSHGDSA
jgi:hypothetical protein